MTKYDSKLKELIEKWFSLRRNLNDKEYKMLKDLCSEVLK